MFNALKSGGPLMIPIILCGLCAIFIIVERIVYFFNLKKRDKVFLTQLQTELEKRDFAAAETCCVLSETPCAQVMKTLISNRHLNEADLKELVQTKMDSVVPQFEHLLSALGTIASISTMLGLLGTVTGNIKAFGVLSNGGTMGDPALLANAIAQALITTVGGLAVSIPSIIFQNYFNNRVNHNIRDMESEVTQTMFKILGKF